MKALVVDDDEVVRKLLKAYLADHFDLAIAKDGAEALTLFSEAVFAGEPFGLVCIDIMMPQMSGVDLLKKLRALEADAALYGDEAAKVLMVTAVVAKETVAQAFREGCDGYVIKPLERAELLRQLSALKVIAGGLDMPSKDTASVGRKPKEQDE